MNVNKTGRIGVNLYLIKPKLFSFMVCWSKLPESNLQFFQNCFEIE